MAVNSKTHGSKSGKPTPSECRGAAGKSRRRLGAVLLCSLAVLAAVGWWTGAFATWPLLYARQSIAQRNVESARSWLRAAETLNGDTAQVALLKARLSRQGSDFAAMNEHLTQAQAAGADRERIRQERALAAAQTGQLQEVEPYLKRWLENPGEDGAELCDAYSNGLSIVGRLAEAEALLAAWESGFPDDPKPHVKRGRIAEHALAYEGAEQEYRTALEKQPNYAPALYSLARLLEELKRPEEALPLFRRCAEAAPATAPAARVGEAKCLRLLGKLDEARALLEQTVAAGEQAQRDAFNLVGFQPDGDPAAFELGKLESSQDNFQAAEKWLRTALAKNPFDLEARYALAVALRGLGRNDEAQAELEHVSQVRRELAKTEEWRTILTAHPDDVEARYNVAMVYLQHQSPRLGLYWLQSVLAYDPDHAPTHRALADYYKAHEDEATAYEELAAYHRSMAQRAATE